MKKSDKIVALIGAVIIILAAVGIYFFAPLQKEPVILKAKDFASMTGQMVDEKYLPAAIEVSDSDPFYALIVTPLAIHYNGEGNRRVVPLYIKNTTNPSDAIVKAQRMINIPIDLIINEQFNPKEISINLAKKYWKSSEAAVVIENTQLGYEVGLVLTPVASYLSIPVIITDRIDKDVIQLLSELKVNSILACGNLTTDKFDCYRFEIPDDALNFAIELTLEKFGSIDYITMTNPLDCWRPKVLERIFNSSGEKELWSSSTTQIVRMLFGLITGKTIATFNFTIPKDYKYALVKVEVVNLNPEGVDEFNDRVSVQGGIVDPNEPSNFQQFELISYGESSSSTPAIRDATGKVIKDRAYIESILYDRGGATYELQVSGTWLARKTGKVQINVEIEKLENPYYAMMKGPSTNAPYLTAYHKGILFAKKEFAFYPTDDTLTKRGEKCSGFYSVRKNPKLAYAHNMHVFKNIHEPLNKLLAKLANIDLSTREGLKNLRDYYDNNPIYIAVVGDAEMMPRIVYDNFLNPLEKEAGPYSYAYGLGTPSDFIYGNIDPIIGDYSNLANDTYTYYPYQENIVGRLAGWDAQDVSAQIVRTIFYYDIIEKLGDWKNKAAVLVGGGQDFQKPPLRYLVSKLTGNDEEAVKLPTGYGKISVDKVEEVVYKPMGFDVLKAYDYEAQLVGFSEKALAEIKNVCLLNKLLFFKNYVAKFLGEDVSKGKEYIENSNFIFLNGHGNPYNLLAPGPSTLGLGIGGPLFRAIVGERILTCIDGGFMGPGFSLSEIGAYSPRSLQRVNLNPSVIWVDSCLVGKIDGVYPQNSFAMAFIHAGANALILPPMESNIDGGYLHPKNRLYDTPLTVARAYINTTLNAKKGIYPDTHFGYLMYEDLCKYLMKNQTIGLALRNAKNVYLPKDANSTFWWSPPLVTTGNAFIDMQIQKQRSEAFKKMGVTSKNTMLENKYFAFQEYVLYGDPMFNPYVPNESS